MLFLPGVLALVIAQASPAPSPMPTFGTTPCPLSASSPAQVTFPVRVDISAASATNFVHFNQDGHGSFMVIMRLDGTSVPIVSPTKDIDPALKASILSYIKKIRLAPTVACSNVAGIFLLRFEVPSGLARAARVEPPAKPSPTP